jgi:hypothetical protein
MGNKILHGYDFSDKKYFAWLFAVKKLGVWPFKVWSNETILDWNGWRSYYDEGFTPMDAIEEDLKYAK